MTVPSNPVGPSGNGDEYYASCGMEVLHGSAMFGDPDVFAVGAGVGYRSPTPDWHMCLGHFCIYLNGFRYGIVAPDATALGCSFADLRHRILRRGEHRCYFADQPAREIVHAYRTWFYAMGPDRETADYLGRRGHDFQRAILDNDLGWAPDGDEAFDDGSYVLQFDIDDQHCRLIGFRSLSESEGLFDPATLRDVVLPSQTFYGILQSCEAWFADTMKMPAADRLPNVTREDRYEA